MLHERGDQLPDADADGDGLADCDDGCAADPAKSAPGECGCGRAEGNWTLLDSRTDERFAGRFVTKVYEIDNSTAYRMYRLDITSNSNPVLANSTQLAELEFVGGDNGGGHPGSGTGLGLTGTYFDNANFTGEVLRRLDATVTFDWGSGSPAPSIHENSFSVRWSGLVEAPVSGVYTFSTRSDDGVRLWIGDTAVVDNWTDHGPTEDAGTIELEAGQRYPIQLDYYENGGGSVIQLSWEPPGVEKSIVPQDHLYPSNSGVAGP